MVCREDLIPLAGHLSQMGGQAGITAVPMDSSGPGLPRKRSQCSFSYIYIYIYSASSYVLDESCYIQEMPGPWTLFLLLC